MYKENIWWLGVRVRMNKLRAFRKGFFGNVLEEGFVLSTDGLSLEIKSTPKKSFKLVI